MLDYFPDVPHEMIAAGTDFNRTLSEMAFTRGKRVLWLTRFPGRFLKPCPGTAESYRCCNYLVINETTNCPIDCTYCILQAYINNPAVTVYTNYQKICAEMGRLSQMNPGRILRVGTGELTDSLALDPVTGLSRELIGEIQSLPNLLLELKSKTDHIDHLLHLQSQRVVLSWSVNPGKIVRSDEHKAAPPERRLAAARKAAEKGFLIGLHFDPVLHYPGWREGYRELIRQIGHHVDPARIAWISIGSLRYPPALKETARARFPGTRLFSGEQVVGRDGKMRYLRPLRKGMYRFIVQALRETLGDVFIYFCMESEEMWREIIGPAPADNRAVDLLFARSLAKKFPELKLPHPHETVYRRPIRFPEPPDNQDR